MSPARVSRSPTVYDWQGAQRHLGLIRLLAKRVEQSWDLRYLDHDDLVQVGLVAAAHALPRFDAAKGAVSTWVGAHAQGAMKNLVKTTTYLRLPLHHWDTKDEGYRRATRVPTVLDPHGVLELPELVASIDPGAAAEEREELASLYQAIGDLPMRLRRVLVARFFDGRTFADIADELGVCKQRVRQLQLRAVEACAKHLSRRRRAVCA